MSSARSEVICPLDQELCDDEGDRHRCLTHCKALVDRLLARLDEGKS